MHADAFSLQRYFQRIGFEGEARTDIGAIAEMMRRQLFTVPFENGDVQSGKGVSLDPEVIVDKILGRGRGGYCYEVNGLFAMALQALGVPYRFVAARPMFYPAKRPRTHMAVVARVEGADWLCDLGFGSYGIRAPLCLAELDVAVRQDGDAFMLGREGGDGYVLKALVDGTWTSQYAFDLAPQDWIDFVPANYFNSTHPDTIFVQKLLVIVHDPAGRTILCGDMLTTITHGRVEKRRIAPEERVPLLSSVFGLRLDACSSDRHEHAPTGPRSIQ
jgi:N-hydroxyarylamine O-acetyltransferase